MTMEHLWKAEKFLWKEEKFKIDFFTIEILLNILSMLHKSQTNGFWSNLTSSTDIINSIKSSSIPERRFRDTSSTFKFVNGLSMWRLSLFNWIPDTFNSCSLELSGVNIPSGKFRVSAIARVFKSERFWKTNLLSIRFIWKFPLMLSVFKRWRWFMMSKLRMRSWLYEMSRYDKFFKLTNAFSEIFAKRFLEISMKCSILNDFRV